MMMLMSAFTIMMTFIIVLLCTSISTFAISAADVDATTKEQQKASSTSTVAFQHSLDGGKTWIERGRIDMESFEFEPTSDNNNKWTKEQLDQLRALALKRVNTPTTTTTTTNTAAATSVASTSLLVRIIDVATSEVHTSLAVSPCALIVPRQYTSQLTYIAERYGITVGSASGSGTASTTSTTINSLRLMNPFHDEVCEPSVFKVKDTRSGSNSDLVKLKISFVKSPQLKNIAFPYGTSSSNTIEDTGANLHDGAAGRRGRVNTNNKNSNDENNNNKNDGQQPPAEEKSFWEKYGTYIMIFFAVQTLGGLFGPKQQQQQGGGKQKAE